MDTEILLYWIEDCEKKELHAREILLWEKLEALNIRKQELEVQKNHIELILFYTQTEINMIINHQEFHNICDS